MVEPSRTQRLGAYAVIVSEDRMLLTRISAKGYPVGQWNLPGGGVDHGESPHDAVRRELFEEAGLKAVTAKLVDVSSIHVIDLGRNDAYEDYHGIALLYVVTVDPESEPRVVEIGGTTDRAEWVRLDDIGTADYPIVGIVEHVLANPDQFAAPT
ncbi:MAG: NUDIX domain-containing protein [Kineosporiaceae bacterium]|nr:NUDIX domain-containing protein [Aeromicrobium sp.]